jgi:endonuclease YncB( thermonuclease family)
LPDERGYFAEMTKPKLLIAVLIAAFPAVSQADPVRLSDGDSFRLGDQRYRLNGIDAPELHQECKDEKGHNWSCGIQARSELRRLIGTHPLECKAVTVDRFGRVVATCHAGGRDLSEEMVRSGFATVFTRNGVASPYERAQREARTEKRGIWGGSFDIPSDWRRANPREGEPAPGFNAREWLARTLSQAREWLQARLGY